MTAAVGGVLVVVLLGVAVASVPSFLQYRAGDVPDVADAVLGTASGLR